MAGIGFRLQKLLTGKSFTDLVRAYVYSALISTGPVIVVIFVLAAMAAFARKSIGISDSRLFMGLVTYVYCFSMIVTGPILYVITRYLADKYFLKRFEAFSTSYISVIEVVFSIQALVGFLYLLRHPFPFGIKMVLVTLLLLVSGIWIAMVYLSAARNYQWIGLGFVLGGFVSLSLSYYMGYQSGLPGFLKGYTWGQAITFLVLTLRIFKEFGYASAHDFGFMAYFLKHPYLVFVGTFYFLAIWIDKIIFWFSSFSQLLSPGFRVCADYDTPMFLAYLTIVPSMAYFVIQIETSFVVVYQDYYKSIRERLSFSVLEKKREILVDNVARNFQKFILFQGVISGLVILFVTQIAEVLHLSPFQMGIFRIGVLSCFIQMGFLVVLNLLFYFDFQKEIFFCCLLYFVSNVVFTLLSLEIGLPAYGYGVALANFVTLLVAYLILDSKLTHLHYWTFMPQPIFTPKYKFETEVKTD